RPPLRADVSMPMLLAPSLQQASDVQSLSAAGTRFRAQSDLARRESLSGGLQRQEKLCKLPRKSGTSLAVEALLRYRPTPDRGSSNGRTAAFGAAHQGSNPCPRTSDCCHGYTT